MQWEYSLIFRNHLCMLRDKTKSLQENARRIAGQSCFHRRMAGVTGGGSVKRETEQQAPGSYFSGTTPFLFISNSS